MKKSLVVLGISFSASLIVVSLLLPVNHSGSRLNNNHSTLTADGDPLPLPPPPPPSGGNQSSTLVADGDPLPLPPPPPPSGSQSVFFTGTGLAQAA
jgi:hypothetical protein